FVAYLNSAPFPEGVPEAELFNNHRGRLVSVGNIPIDDFVRNGDVNGAWSTKDLRIVAIADDNNTDGPYSTGRLRLFNITDLNTPIVTRYFGNITPGGVGGGVFINNDKFISVTYITAEDGVLQVLIMDAKTLAILSEVLINPSLEGSLPFPNNNTIATNGTQTFKLDCKDYL